MSENLIRTMSGQITARIREKILTGVYPPGSALLQDVIAAEFGVSKIPVREALSHLAGEGLVKIVGNRGAVVAALSPDEIMQLFETRAVLESYILRQAIPNMMKICSGQKIFWCTMSSRWNTARK